MTFFLHVTSFMHFSHNVFLSVLYEPANLMQNNNADRLNGCLHQFSAVPLISIHLQPYTFTEDYFKLAVTIFHPAIG